MSLIDEYYKGEFEISDEFTAEMVYLPEKEYIWLPVQKDCRPFSTKAWRRTKKYSVGPKGKLLDDIPDFYQALLMLQKMELGDISFLPPTVNLFEVKTCCWRGEGFDGNAHGVISRSKWVKFPSVSVAEAYTMGKRNLDIEEKELETISDSQILTETEKNELRKSRIGQGVFRRRVLNNWDHRCAVTQSEILLTASHIKPWRISNNEERLHGDNGLSLSPVYDKAFDAGIISFTNSGEIIISVENKDNLQKLGIKASDCLFKQPNDNTKVFLAWHRKRYCDILGKSV